ncbi:hypothetical protein [Eubacterium sp.]|uniref:hypothetical protein n=1 Tax=Eubacterium sp. TaxID=142586 RepID=UPI0025BE601B|nr:hypothetical protein [Eubacterium sp.]
MKKIFKKSLVCLIAVLMIVSSLPFATLTASAATTTSTATVSAYGIIKGSDQGRFTDPKLTICNDAQDGNFTIGFVNFDISNISCTDLDEVSASYNFTSAMASNCSENMGLSVWYPTANYTDFDQSTGEYKLSDINTNSSRAVFKGDNSGHIGNTTSHYSMKKLGDFTTNGSSHTVNIGNAIKFAKQNGRSIATICFMITSAGGKADENSSWTDTIVTINNKTVAVNVEQNSSSLPTAVLKFEKDMKAMAAGTVMYKNVNTAYNAYVNYFNVRKSLCEGNGGDLAAALTTLTNAVATMEASTFTAPTGNFIDKLGSTKIFVDADNSSTDEYKQIYKNVLYSETGMTDAGTAAGTAKNVNFTSGESGFTTDNKVVIPEATVLYNGGDTPQVGAMYALWGNSKPNLIYNWNNLRVFAVYVSNTSDVQFAGKWKGLDGRLNMTWVWLTQSERNISGTGDTTSGYYNQGTRDEKFYANILQVKKTFGESDPLLTEYTPNFDVRVGQDKANAKDTLTGSKVIRVINYNYVIGKIKSAEAKYYGNIAKYRQGGLSTVISTLDEVMAKNPNDYFAVGTNNYSGLVSFYNTKFNTVKSSNPTVDTAVNHADSSYDWTVTKAATCTTAGSKTGVCKYCDETTVREIPATGHEYTYTYVDKTHHIKKCTKGDFEEQEEHTLGTDGKCTVCKGTVIDYTAYDAAVDVAGAIMMHMTEYTDESYAEFYKIVTGATAKKGDAKTQEDLDALTYTIQSAQTVLRKKTVTVTLQIEYVNSAETVKYENQEYGTPLEIDLATLDQPIKNVDKWTISTDDGATTTKLSTTDTKLTLYVTKSATVTVYELDEPNDSETVKYSKVVFLGKNGVIVDIKYVKQGDTKTPAELGVTVPKVPFYTSNGWDNESITGTDKTIYVRAKYTASPKDEDMCNVHFGEWSRKYSYDSFVRPDGIDPSKQYALASDAKGENILTYLEGVDFYAPKTSDIYVVEVTERVAKTGITGHFKGSDDTHRWATYNCKFYLPKDCTAIEWGLEVAVGKQKQLIKAEHLSKGNEYTVNARVKTNSTLHSVTCRSYVTYKQNGETKTIYSDVAVDQAF